MPAPARPEVFLQGAYGPDWRVPNPAFEFTTPRTGQATHRRLVRWTARAPGLLGPPVPAQATGSPRTRARSPGGWPARSRRECWSTWAAETAGTPGSSPSRGTTSRASTLVPNASRRVLKEMEPDQRPEVLPFNLESLRQTLAAGARASFSPDPVTVYGRFLLHALSDRARQHFWRYTSMALRSGGRGYLEFRTEKDSSQAQGVR